MNTDTCCDLRDLVLTAIRDRYPGADIQMTDLGLAVTMGNELYGIVIEKV